VAGEDVVEVGEALGALVDDDRTGADADGDLGRVGADGAAAMMTTLACGTP